MISEQTLSDIRSRIDIVEIVGEYVQLKKAGQSYTGLCPFHQEKTPSFHVHSVRQCFRCFGCQKGGNLFTFLMAIEGLSFPDVVRKLAERVGVILEAPATRREPQRSSAPQAPKVLEALDWAARYYHYLLSTHKDFQYARDYVASRKLSSKTVEKFQLGVAPKGWRTLIDIMSKRGFSFSDLCQAGLAIEKEGAKGQGYDRFRHRLIFPIRDVEGKVIGFGGRRLEEEDQPKYLNSPETSLFSKRLILYGLHENQRGIRVKGELILVEGYMDVVGLYEHGVNNAVASMGTSLTEEHCATVRALTRRVVTAFDPDAAGNTASRRSIPLLLQYGIFAKDLSLPAGKDPDEYVAAYGADSFYQLCEKAPKQLTRLLKDIASQGPLSEDERARLLSELTPVLIASRRLPEKAVLWDNLSVVLKVSLATLNELATPKNPLSAKEKPNLMTLPRKAVLPRELELNRLDLDFLKSALQNPMRFLATPPSVWRETLKEKRVLELLEKLAVSSSKASFESELSALLARETHPRLSSILAGGVMEKESEKGSEEAYFLALVERLKKIGIEARIQALSAEIKMSERLGNSDEQLALLARLKELRSLQKSIVSH